MLPGDRKYVSQRQNNTFYKLLLCFYYLLIFCYLAFWLPLDWIVQCFSPLQHSIGYMGDGFYRSKDPTNSIEVLKENLQKTNQKTETTQNRHA